MTTKASFESTATSHRPLKSVWYSMTLLFGSFLCVLFLKTGSVRAADLTATMIEGAGRNIERDSSLLQQLDALGALLDEQDELLRQEEDKMREQDAIIAWLKNAAEEEPHGHFDRAGKQVLGDPNRNLQTCPDRCFLNDYLDLLTTNFIDQNKFANIVEKKTRCIHNSSSGRHLHVSGCNVYLDNKFGHDIINGRGNLLVGGGVRLGNTNDVSGASHSLVIGDENVVSSYSGLVVGEQNTVVGPYASVLAGMFHL